MTDLLFAEVDQTLQQHRGFRDRIEEEVARAFPADALSHHAGGKIFRDPISGFIELRPHEINLIDCPGFQRLRGIFQTGLASLVYPSALHSRFEHSINTVLLLNRLYRGLDLYDHVQRALQGNQEEEKALLLTLRLACLLHDLGHCVFSHASESTLATLPPMPELLECPPFRGKGASEVLTCVILRSDAFSRYFAALQREYASDKLLRRVLPSNLARLAVGIPAQGLEHLQFLTELISGPFDVDKLDYMVRDGYFSGQNVQIDADRLRHSLDVRRVDGMERLVLRHRGLSVAQQILFGRMTLYSSVYNHHKVRAAETVLRSALRQMIKTGRLRDAVDLWRMDEYDFFALQHEYPQIRDIRLRRLPHRAIVFTPLGFEDQRSRDLFSRHLHSKIAAWESVGHAEATGFLEELEAAGAEEAEKALGRVSGSLRHEVVMDVPRQFTYGDITREVYVSLDDGQRLVRLCDVAPFETALERFSERFDYRSYLFAPMEARAPAAAGVYRHLRRNGVVLNDLPLLLSSQSAQGLEALRRSVEQALREEDPTWTLPRWKAELPDLPEEPLAP
ncbi:MAG: HD domain-containing protein [Planctomycetes bacterium]|nr:HD domain-containing protein [Planctomycetota bacterium]